MPTKIRDIKPILENKLSTYDQQVLKLQKELGISGYMLAKLIGYKSTDSVYKVARGKTHFGTQAMFALKIAYPNLNLNYFFNPSVSPWLEDLPEEAIDKAINSLLKIKNLKKSS
jgi:hypothetical protein